MAVARCGSGLVKSTGCPPAGDAGVRRVARPRTELRGRGNPPPAPARDPGARGAVLWRVQRPARPARRCRSGALAGPPRHAQRPFRRPVSAPDGDPTHQGPGKPPDAFQPRITLPEHTNSPRQPKPKQTGKPAPPGRGTKRQSMPGPQPNPTDPPPHRGAPGGRPPGKNCEPLARPKGPSIGRRRVATGANHPASQSSAFRRGPGTPAGAPTGDQSTGLNATTKPTQMHQTAIQTTRVTAAGGRCYTQREQCRKRCFNFHSWPGPAEASPPG